MSGRISSYISEQLRHKKALIFALIDSENATVDSISEIASKTENAGADAILVGGSTAVDQLTLDKAVIAVKKSVTIPVILFPGNVTGVSPNADAILFASLLNSEDPYFITGAQALGSILVRNYHLEALSTGYIIAGEGGAAGFVGHVRPFPPNKPELVALYALAAHYMGMQYVYLEAGSGAGAVIPPEMIKAVRRLYKGMLIVGGGIKDSASAISTIEAGANILVIGNLIETVGFEHVLRAISNAAHRPPKG